MNKSRIFTKPQILLIREEVEESLLFLLGITNPKIKSYPVEVSVIAKSYIDLLDDQDLSLKTLISKVELELGSEIKADLLESMVLVYESILFKASRLILGFTQQEMSQELDLSIRQITNIETGRRELQKQTKMAVELLVIKNSKSIYLKSLGFNQNCFD